jgi:hypothetical protein
MAATILEGSPLDSTTAALDASVPQTPPDQAGSRLPRFFLSSCIVLLASLLAGFSIAQLLDRPIVGFRSIDEAERNLPIPVLGAVPVRSLMSK